MNTRKLKKYNILLLILVICHITVLFGFTQKRVEPLSNTEQKTEQKVEEMIKEMTLSQKVGQMIFFAFRRNDDGSGVTKMSKAIENSVKYYNMGGIVLFSENIQSVEQVTGYINELQKVSNIPLFISADEEGGRVLRTKALNVPRVPSALSIGNTGDVKKAYEWSKTIADYLVPMGFNVDFAPVADVYTNPANKVIGDRAFSKDAYKAGEMVREFTKGLLDNGLLPTLKHFPGHGDTTEDSHYGMATTKKTLDELSKCEFIPFQQGIDAGSPFVMVGHISAPNIIKSNEPALFSEFLLKDILRDTMKFDGIIITDALDMGAISKYFTYSEAAVKAVLAGVDMLLTASNISDVYNGILNAVNTGRISEERINESVRRILTVKYEAGLVN